MSHLADLLMRRIGRTEIEEVSRRVDADPRATGDALRAAVPMLVAALARNTASDEGRRALAGALDRDHDGAILDGVRDFVASGGAADGEAILGHVLGDRRPLAAQGLGRAAGLAPDKAGQVLALVAPLVMGALGRTKRERDLDAGGLAGLLAGEGEGHRASLGGLAALLDRDGDGQVADDVLGGIARGLGGTLFGG
jgi:hypothetical protein